MTDKQVKVARVFMLIFGLVLIFAGIYILYIGRVNFKETFISYGHFFISGGILTFLGFTWRKNKK